MSGNGRTFALVKPDALEAGHLGAVLTRIEEEGFVIEEMAMLQLTPGRVASFYAEHVEKPFYPAMCEFMCSRPVVAAVLAGESAIARWRAALGPTDSRTAWVQDQQQAHKVTVQRALGHLDHDDYKPTLRGLYGNQEGIIFRNIAHGSDSAVAAAREIELYRTLLRREPS